MKKTLFIGLIMVLLIASTSFALIEPKDDLPSTDLCSDLMDLASVGKTMPGFAPFKNEVFNVYNLEGKDVGHVVVEGKEITEVECTIADEATYKVFIKDGETIKSIKSAEKPVSAYKEALKEGTIVIEGQSFGKKFKMGFVNVLTKIASWFD